MGGLSYGPSNSSFWDYGSKGPCHKFFFIPLKITRILEAA